MEKRKKYNVSKSIKWNIILPHHVSVHNFTTWFMPRKLYHTILTCCKARLISVSSMRALGSLLLRNELNSVN